MAFKALTCASERAHSAGVCTAVRETVSSCLQLAVSTVGAVGTAADAIACRRSTSPRKRMCRFEKGARVCVAGGWGGGSDGGVVLHLLHTFVVCASCFESH